MSDLLYQCVENEFKAFYLLNYLIITIMHAKSLTLLKSTNIVNVHKPVIKLFIN